MSARERDYSYEALAEATGTDMVAGRGELNISLKTIRQQSEGLTDYALADEIHARAKLYRDVMGEEIMLTPTALAKHWRRVFEEGHRSKVTGTNQHSGHEDCETCGGDRFVVVSVRKPAQTQWMVERGIEPATDSLYEEMASCPDCNPTDTSFWRHDGTRAGALDPARVREMMRS